MNTPLPQRIAALLQVIAKITKKVGDAKSPTEIKFLKSLKAEVKTLQHAQKG